MVGVAVLASGVVLGAAITYSIKKKTESSEKQHPDEDDAKLEKRLALLENSTFLHNRRRGAHDGEQNASPEAPLFFHTLVKSAPFGCNLTSTFRQAAGDEEPVTRTESSAYVTKCWTPLKVDKAGVITDLVLDASLPYNMSVGGGTDASIHVTTCTLHRSHQITNIIHGKLRSQAVSGIPGVYFGDLVIVQRAPFAVSSVCTLSACQVDLVIDKGAARVYIYGGFLRDVFMGKAADDLDFLFRSSGGSIIPFLVTCRLQHDFCP